MCAPRRMSRPVPDADASPALHHGLFRRQPLPQRRLAGDDDVDPVPGAQHMVGHTKQRIGSRRQINPHDVHLFVHRDINEPRVLMAEAVVILMPDMAGQQIVQ